MQIVFATATAMAGHVAVVAGQHWPADDPIVQAYPSLFTADPKFGLTYTATPAEQATAVPGEKRTLPRVDQSFDEAADLRATLAQSGVNVDNRWGLARLRQEAAKLDD